MGGCDDLGGMFGAQDIVGIPQYYMLVKYELKGYSDQAALPDKQQTIMDASFEAVDGDIVLKLNNFPGDDRGNDIIVDGPQNFIYVFSCTLGEGHRSNRGKHVINLSSGGSFKVPDPYQGKWLYHDILAGLSWVFLTLWAFGDDLFQYFLPPGPIWFNIHE